MHLFDLRNEVRISMNKIDFAFRGKLGDELSLNYQIGKFSAIIKTSNDLSVVKRKIKSQRALHAVLQMRDVRTPAFISWVEFAKSSCGLGATSYVERG